MIRLMGLVGLPPVNKLTAEAEEKWIQAAIKKPGALHKQLGVPEGEKIPVEKLKAAAKRGGKLGQRARLALTLRGIREEYKMTDEQAQKVDGMIAHLEKEVLVGNQKKLDVDGDGKIEADDLAKLRAGKKNEVVNEDANDGEEPSNVGDHEGYMAKAQLMSLNKQSGELYNMIGEQEGLEAWVQDKISKASDYVNAVYNYLQYEKNKPNSLGDGEGSPADTSVPMNNEV